MKLKTKIVTRIEYKKYIDDILEKYKDKMPESELLEEVLKKLESDARWRTGNKLEKILFKINLIKNEYTEYLI